MTVDDRARLRLRQWFEEHMGDELADAMMEFMPSDRSEPATKTDLALLGTELRTEMSEVRLEMSVVRTEMADLKVDLRSEMADLKVDLSDEMAGLRHEMTTMRSDMTRVVVTSTVASAASGWGLLLAALAFA